MRSMVRRWLLFALALLLLTGSGLEAAPPAQSFIYIGVVWCTSLLHCSPELQVYDARSNARVITLALPFGYTDLHIATSPDGSRLYVSSGVGTAQGAGTLRVIDATRHRLIRDVSMPAGVAGPVAVRFDGSRVYLAGPVALGIVDTATWQVTTLPWAEGARSLAAHLFLDRLYVGETYFALTDSDRIMRELDGDGLVLRQLAGPALAPTVSSDGAHLLAISPSKPPNYHSGSAFLVDTATFSEIARYPAPSASRPVFSYPAMAVEDVARRLIYVTAATGLSIVDRASGNEVVTLPLTPSLGRMALSADATRLWVLARSTNTFVPRTPMTPLVDTYTVIDTTTRQVVASQWFSGALSDISATPATATTACSYRVNAHDLAYSVNGGVSSMALSTGCDWQTRVDVPWLRLSVPQGQGSAALTLTVDPNYTTTNRSTTVTIAGQVVHVTQASFSAVPAFGVIDTPSDNLTGVTGSLALTGWALDDIGVTRVRVVRDPVAGETSGSEVFVGEATFVDGARPDVQAAFPSVPNGTRAGWGLMVLTNMLPGGGNGTYRLTAYADDAEGHTTWLGSRTVTAANSTSAVPFGAIDTPAQGEVVSGTIVNFGWALTPPSSVIPSDGSTIDVLVDGVVVGHPTYGNFRPDIAALFPGYANTAGAVGHFVIDTTLYSNGVHTIAWVVRDNAGRAAGIGSRYFTIENP